MFKLSNSKLAKREQGILLEKYAAEQLQQAGCKIIETNFLCKLGEIDLIVKDKNYLVFVEVRYRKQTSFGGAALSVNQSKQRKICNTARLYLQQHQMTDTALCRFDVFAIEGPLEHCHFQWIKNAFYPSTVF